MSEHERKDPLDAMLRAEHVDDAGFTERVMGQLPPQRKRAPRRALVGGAAAIGTAVVLASPATTDLWTLWTTVDSGRYGTSALVALCAVLLVLGGSAVQAAFNE